MADVLAGGDSYRSGWLLVSLYLSYLLLSYLPFLPLPFLSHLLLIPLSFIPFPLVFYNNLSPAYEY